MCGLRKWQKEETEQKEKGDKEKEISPGENTPKWSENSARALNVTEINQGKQMQKTAYLATKYHLEFVGIMKNIFSRSLVWRES